MTLEKTEIEKLISQAKKVGFDTVPQNLDEITTKIVEIMRQTEQIFTAKVMYNLIKERNTKFYSDKMWNLAKKGVLVKLPTRGYYKYNFDTKSE